MKQYKFTYSDGLIKFYNFRTKKEASWFAYNEGDHLIKYELILDKNNNMRYNNNNEGASS